MSEIQMSILTRLIEGPILVESDGKVIHDGHHVNRRTIDSLVKRGLIWVLPNKVIISEVGLQVIHEHNAKVAADAASKRLQALIDQKRESANRQIVDALSRICVERGGPPFGEWGNAGASALVIAGDLSSNRDLVIQIDTWGGEAVALAEAVQAALDGWRGPLLGFNFVAIACMSLPRLIESDRTLSEWRLVASDESVGDLGFGDVFERFGRDLNQTINDTLRGIDDELFDDDSDIQQ